jgi:photosystem II stability/assembly factor-like uncharacterized protein
MSVSPLEWCGFSGNREETMRDFTRQCRSVRGLALVALLALGSQVLGSRSAAALDWTALGPDGGTTFDLVVEPGSGSVYVGTRGGVFKSTDGGVHWVSANGNLPVDPTARGLWVVALAVDGGSPPAVYASVLLQGVFKSVDGGQTWQRVHSGLIGTHAEILVADPRTSGSVYAKTSGGLFRTTDGGGLWSQLPGVPEVTAIGIDPFASETAYAGLSAGLRKTVDGGQTWAPIGSSVLGTLRIDAIAVDPRLPNRLFVATVDFGAGNANLFRSDNGGVTWTAASSGLTLARFSRITALATPPSTPDVVFAGVTPAGVFKSTDGGVHWSISNGALDFVEAFALDPATGGGLYAAGSSSSASGVFKTADGGGSWTFRSEGIAAFELRDVVVDPKTPSTLYALSFAQGILKSIDGGDSWHTVNQGLTASGSRVFVDTLTIDPVDSRILYASSSSGLFKTLDGGQHWAPKARPGTEDILVLDVDPQDPRILVAATREGLFRSIDGGTSWVRTRESVTYLAEPQLVRDPASPAAIYAAVRDVTIGSPGRSDGFLLKSVDHGSTWSVVSEEFFSSSLQIDPNTPSTLFATAGSSVVKSTDGGIHWSVVAHSPGSSGFIRALLVDPLDPSTFIVDTDEELLRSDDSGQTWRPWSDGLANRDIYALVFDPAIPHRLYVATRGGGLSARFLSELAPCTPGPTRLCFHGGRFQAEVSWRAFDGRVGEGNSRELGGDTGAFWFFGPDNVELTVKILDGRALNDRFWVFYGSLTNVEFTLTVIDTAAGRMRRYHNPSGAFASAGDTSAF